MPGFLFDRILHIIPAAYKNDSIGLSYPTVARFLYAMLPGVAVEAVMDVRNAECPQEQIRSKSSDF